MKTTHLTVSGQLNGETYAMAFRNSYIWTYISCREFYYYPSCGKFWMIEPEIAFADLKDNMRLAEECLSI